MPPRGGGPGGMRGPGMRGPMGPGMRGPGMGFFGKPMHRMMGPMPMYPFMHRIILGSWIYLWVAGSYYKFAPTEVEQIEQYNGKSTKKLTEKELISSMKTLEIENREVSNAEIAKIDEMTGKAKSDKTVYCSYCGAKIANSNAKFCTQCGSRL